MATPDKVIDLTKDVMDFADDSFESGEEITKASTERLRIDNSSKFALPALIRPISLLISWTVIISLAVAVILGVEVNEWIMGEFLLMHSTILAFYFRNRSKEKTAAKNASANVKIKELETRAEIKSTRKEERNQRRLDRIKARKENN